MPEPDIQYGIEPSDTGTAQTQAPHRHNIKTRALSPRKGPFMMSGKIVCSQCSNYFATEKSHLSAKKIVELQEGSRKTGVRNND